MFMEQFNYIVVNEELDIGAYIPYFTYNDIVRYYNVENQLHKHECVKDHYTLTVF